MAIALATTSPAQTPAARASARGARGRLRHPQGLAGAIVLVLVVIVAIGAPVLAPYDPLSQDLDRRLVPPALLGGTLAHLLGTDELGRDIVSRLMFGAGVSLTIGFAAVVISGVLGTAAGVVAGFYGGFVDEVIMRLADLRMALPFILLVIVAIVVFGPGLQNVIVILGVTGWVPYARVVRGEVLSLRTREFVLAARTLGARDGRLMLRHILPNVLASAIVIGSLELANVILVESSLSFLGLGVQPPTPSWGNMLGTARDYLLSTWWLATLPGLAIAVTTASINLVGDWVRDALDPHMRDQ
jgi:peptide/nickel transport system permease protein